MMRPAAAILGVEGQVLGADERAFLREADPLGFILFARNVDSRDQLAALTDALREAVGRDAPILIDQEGGRVQRLGPPQWRRFLPALDQMARAADPMRAQWLRGRLIADELHAVGIDVNAAPLADLVEPETHRVLRNRLYGSDIATVIEAARVLDAAHRAGGVLSVLKHIPGYGRAHVDSHLDIARVTASAEALQARDFAPFHALRQMKMGMTSHVIYEAIDPDQPATLSPAVITMIRKQIGFDGLLMTDDISMEALSGGLTQRCWRAIGAGCDIVLHSNGKLREMELVVAASGPMGVAGLQRAEAALAQRQRPEPVDIAALAAELDSLLS